VGLSDKAWLGDRVSRVERAEEKVLEDARQPRDNVVGLASRRR
jgi:hypothetical protein